MAWSPWRRAMIASVGSTTTIYGFTGEQQDIYIKLIDLRSRLLDPATGRFLTKDSWQGDYNRPQSLNQWNYVEGNPVNLSDPSGNVPDYCTHIDPHDWPNVPGCPGYVASPPPTTGYNPRTPPLHITWIDDEITQRITANGAPGLSRDISGIQLKVPGHACTEGHNCAYCGQVAVAAILGVNVKTVVEDMQDPSKIGLADNVAASAVNLAAYINDYYSDQFKAVIQTPRISPFSELGSWLGDNLSHDNAILALVWIANANSGYEPAASENNPNIPNTKGVISSLGTTNHWVVITGRSVQWQADTEDVRYKPETASHWNWVRIFNSFSNQNVYYWWGDFLPAL